jgi:hypothetical protein
LNGIDGDSALPPPPTISALAKTAFARCVRRFLKARRAAKKSVVGVVANVQQRVAVVTDAAVAHKDAAVAKTMAAKDAAVTKTLAVKDAAVTVVNSHVGAAVTKTLAVKDAAVTSVVAHKDAAVTKTLAVKDAAVTKSLAVKDAAVTAVNGHVVSVKAVVDAKALSVKARVVAGVLAADVAVFDTDATVRYVLL